MTRNKLYYLLLITCFTGFIYFLYNNQSLPNETVRVCLFKNVTCYPCPSCGTTRAIALLLEGKITASLLMNPFGIIVLIMMILMPIWILVDVVLKMDTFFNFYIKTELLIRTRWLAVFLIILVLFNWTWNIYKHL
ncbi:DUF2752 domain-containing protein [Flavobacterium sp.]|uniref:DUF2752 domain-containing protein n=1 Tax=Flavobacterium sp. TaxID=239 RepID=UPI0025F0E319|nr:DUF2752 domain-containing protein [Flavobacterium sp.]